MTASSKLRRGRKIINAAVTRRSRLIEELDQLILAVVHALIRSKALYISMETAYINLHLGSATYAFAASQPQSSAPQAGRRPEPPPRTCSCTLVPSRWILRLPRFGAGQVRDAAASTHRRCRQDRGRLSFRRIEADVLSSGSRLCAGGIERTATQVARPEGCAQAHARSHEVYRSTADRRGPAWGSRSLSTDRGQTGGLGPPPQHRTRPGAQKKTIVTAAALPPAAISLYETLRSDVLRGEARPDGLGALVYHGMLRGLALLMSVPPDPLTRQPQMAPASTVRGDRGLVRLLANMVLQTHLEVKHVF
jgi:hypothetical protein